eukprot:TRINITY_DN993_c0_g3_i1.p2 TRINITY_DN993_c0_g3~~TRINITY_DN993_c0_g3_i1.p2  ORF type:complete len:243 (+),score=84.93 TRINITY_DN993_c0_g3_i1:52-780(+)
MMEGGVPDYGCTANAAKTRLSFDLDAARNSSSCYKAADGSMFVPWCGLLINARTCEVQVDYARYHGTSIRDALCVERCANPGEQLFKRMCKCIRYKCHPVTLDSHINSLFVIRLNVYQALLFCAMRLSCYVNDLPQPVDANPLFIADVVVRLVDYTFAAVRLSTSSEQAVRLGCNCPLIAAEVKWLGLHAFQRILRMKQCKFRQVLSVLDAVINQPSHDYYRRHLKDVVDPRHSTIFDKILF